MMRGLWLVASMMACLTLAATSNAQETLVACCSPGSNTCQLLTETNCTDARGIVEGTSCTNVACTGCCQGLAGNPNACSSSFNVVACREGNGTPVLNAHCESTASGAACKPNPTAPALSPRVFVVVAVLLTAAGWLALRRRARE